MIHEKFVTRISFGDEIFTKIVDSEKYCIEGKKMFRKTVIELLNKMKENLFKVE